MPHGEPRYVKEHGSFYFYIHTELLLMADVVAVAVSVNRDDQHAIVLKHGDPKNIAKWRKKHTPELLDAMGIDIIIIESDKWDTDELTKFFTHTGYINIWLKEKGLLDDIKPGHNIHSEIP